MVMPHIDLRLDGDGALAEYQGRDYEQRASFVLTGLRNGMGSGRPSLMIAVDMGEKMLYLETSLRLMENSIRALKIRWGLDPDKPIQ